ncbi:hypothetical protein C8A00DRAFT_19320, partial [Chaetomidium leptoderma]
FDMASTKTAEQFQQELDAIIKRVAQLEDENGLLQQTRDCRSAKKDWKPVPGLDVATIDRNSRVVDVAAASYAQSDLEDAVDAEHYCDDREQSSEEGGVAADEPPPSPPGAENQGFEVDNDGDVAPPAWALGMADTWGLSLIQEASGQWRTTREGETPGPSVAYLQEKIVDIREDLAVALSEKDEQDRQLQSLAQEKERLKAENVRLNTARAAGSTPWEGPQKEGEREFDGVRNPEYEYLNVQLRKESRDEKFQTWEHYWTRHQYISIGEQTAHMQWEGLGAVYQAMEGDAERLDPSRYDHTQVPWFQCIAHECRYHYANKYDGNHWPTRHVGKDKKPKPMTWTYDHGMDRGVGDASLLWTVQRVECDKIRVMPRRAWPQQCSNGANRFTCLTKECLWHLGRKVQQWTEDRAGTERRRPRRRGLVFPAWERASREWLADFPAEGTTPGSSIDERLGNGSGPSAGPAGN